MNLLIITNDFPPALGGIENYTYSLAKRWPPDRVAVLSRWVPGCKKFDGSLDFEVHREPVGTLLPTPGLFQKARLMIRERNIDVVHFPSGLPLGLMGRRLGLPYAVSVHGGEFVLASRLPAVRRGLKSVCRHASVLLPESSFAERLIDRLVGGKVPSRLITSGVEAQRYGREAAPPEPVAAGGPVIISVSRLVERKGQKTLVAAMPAILASHPSAHLLIVGDGPQRARLRKLVHSLGLERCVTLTGPVPWERTPNYLSASDVFALPTRARFGGTETEGLPLSILEAAASALPIVAGDVGGISDAVRPGHTGVLIDESSVSGTTAALLSLLDDPPAAVRMGAAARQMALEEFNWDVIAADYRQALLEHCS